MSKGNSFEYYAPKPVGGSSRPSKVVMAKTSVNGGTPKYVKPYDFIKTHFNKVKKAPFGAGHALDAQSVIREIDILRATLECGYGKRNMWTAQLAMSPAQASELAAYLLRRLEMVASCIELDTAGAHCTRSFYEHLEASEKATVAFVLGGIGAFVTAQHWLKAGGGRLGKFMHAGLYAKAVNGAAPPVRFSSSTGKWPDYLVEAANGDWHVFESKGGGARWLRIVEGLAQIAVLPPISWFGSVPRSVTTSVCVHTRVDAESAIKVTAVDPPGKPSPTGDVGPLTLIESVCNLLLNLEAIDHFRALMVEPILDSWRSEAEPWVYRRSVMFGGMRVGIPRQYLCHEREIRVAVATYLAIQDEVLEDRKKRALRTVPADIFVALVLHRLRVYWRGLDFLGQSDVAKRQGIEPLKQQLRTIWAHLKQENFLQRCAELLGMNRLSEEVRLSDEDQVVARLSHDSEYVVTSGGLFLEQLSAKKNSAEVT